MPTLPLKAREMNQNAWRETYDGATPEAEQVLFERLAKDIVQIQRANQRKAGSANAARTFHSKLVIGAEATLRFDADLQQRFCVGFARPGTAYPTLVRLSNASGVRQADYRPDLRGAALRVQVSAREQHDLLMTSFPVSHARNARQFVAFAKIASGPKHLILPRLVLRFGPSETQRMLRNLKSASRPSKSLARESYWSRGAILWGGAGPVRFRLTPAADVAPPFPTSRMEANVLFDEFAARLRTSDVHFRFSVQTFLDEKRTPIEDGAREWKDEDSLPVAIATLTIPQQDLDSLAAKSAQSKVDNLAFNPWNTTTDFRPLGNLNRARQKVYAASAAGWRGG